MGISVFAQLFVLAVLAVTVSSMKGPKKCSKTCAKPPDCEHGRIVDGNGCPTCRCLPRRCPLMYCKACPEAGFQTDRYGCQTCKCKVICKTPNCRNFCTYGYAVDSSGCLTCRCQRRRPILTADMMDAIMDAREAQAKARMMGQPLDPYFAAVADIDFYGGSYQRPPRYRDQSYGQYSGRPTEPSNHGKDYESAPHPSQNTGPSQTQDQSATTRRNRNQGQSGSQNLDQGRYDTQGQGQTHGAVHNSYQGQGQSQGLELFPDPALYGHFLDIA